MNKTNTNTDNKLLYVFIHKDKIAQVNINNYGIIVDDTNTVLIPKSLCYEVDKLCNFIKIGILINKYYILNYYGNSYEIIQNQKREIDGLCLWKELINNNPQYNIKNRTKELY